MPDLTPIRVAAAEDVPAICRFGEAVIGPHYAPIIGRAAAQDQVSRWWSEGEIARAAASGRVVVADAEGELRGVGQRGLSGEDHAIYKLYVHPDGRGRGIGPRLIAALVQQLPRSTDRLYVEHFAGNGRAGAFYEREGFAVVRVEPGPTAATAVVWRVRALAPGEAGGAHRGPQVVS